MSVMLFFNLSGICQSLIIHRQHFQGLRRAQNKIEGSVASPVDSGPRKVGDPTLNPITRRPGPGRGRPKKQASVPLGGAAAGPGTGPAPSPVQQPLPPVPPTVAVPAQPETATPASEPMAVDPSLEDSDEQPAKRPRVEGTQEPSLEDEAVLNALAAHNNPNAVDHYAPE